MVYRGHVVYGVIVLDDPVRLPEGAAVHVLLAEPRAVEEKPRIEARSLDDQLAAIWADVPESAWAKIPADLTDHLDHYIYGTPKK